MENIVLSIVSMLGTISTILFAYLAFRRNDKKDIKSCAIKEAELLLDMKWVKASITRMEKKIDNLDDNYKELCTKVIKLEERIDNHIKGEK